MKKIETSTFFQWLPGIKKTSFGGKTFSQGNQNNYQNWIALRKKICLCVLNAVMMLDYRF